MARVQMLLQITGGRADGTEWPPAGEILDCGEREARDLVAGAMAAWADEPRPVVPAPAPEPAAGATAASSAGDAPPEPQDGAEGDGDGPKPRVRDPKDAWEAHAVAQGCDPAVAAAATKADLIAQYGSPPD